MKKILLAFDGSHFSGGAFEFARRLNESEPVMLTGVFLPQASYAGLWNYTDGMGGPLFVPLMEGDEPELMEQNIAKFEALCQKNGIDYRVHKDQYDFALPELKKETRFADLIILGSESFYENLGTKEPNEYLKDALHAAECPVVVVPEQFDFPETNILAYDGNESSVFAIKQFTYLFPGFNRNKTLLVSLSTDDTPALPEEHNVEELVAKHFPDLTLSAVGTDVRKRFAEWLRDKKSAIVVSGAFGRSSLSQIFKRSFISDVIRDHRLPVFIAHR